MATTKFGAAFKAARAAGKKEFTWNGKRYHTRTKEEDAAKNPAPAPGPKKEAAGQAPKPAATLVQKNAPNLVEKSAPRPEQPAPAKKPDSKVVANVKAAANKASEGGKSAKWGNERPAQNEQRGNKKIVTVEKGEPSVKKNKYGNDERGSTRSGTRIKIG